MNDRNSQVVTAPAYPITTNGLTLSTEPIYIRNINQHTIAEFQYLLSWENWENIFGNNNINSMFNNFLNTYLRCFNASFLKKEIKYNHIYNNWITKGIKISCKKRENFSYYVDTAMI
jgi:hypothetical protein